MPMSDGDDGGTVIADVVNDFGSLHARQQTMDHTFAVLSLRGDTPTLHQVDLMDPSCTCEDMKYNKTGDNECCDHIAVAAFESSRNFGEAEATAAFTRLLSDAREAVSDLRNLRDVARAAQNANAQAAATQGGTDTASSDGDDDGGEVVDTAVSAGDAEQEIENQLEEWFENAGEFNGFDGSICKVEYAKADGQMGYVVDRNPFESDDPYYDDDEWVDKEGFNDEKDAVKDSILSPRDEFEWYGEPDYAWFVAEEDALEVLD